MCYYYVCIVNGSPVVNSNYIQLKYHYSYSWAVCPYILHLRQMHIQPLNVKIHIINFFAKAYFYFLPFMTPWNPHHTSVTITGKW